MNYNEATIVVTINLEPRLALRGSYQGVQKVDSKGNKIFEVWRNSLDGSIERIPAIELKTLALPKTHECKQRTTLGPQFVKYALSDEARPKKTVSLPWWNKLSAKNKLKIGIQQYVWDLYGRDAEYSFEIIGE